MNAVLGEARPVSAEVAELGEGTRWDGERRELVWVDLLAGVLRTAAPNAAGQLVTTLELRIDAPLGAAAPLADGSGWVVAAGDGLALLSRSGALRWIARPERSSGGATRMNDGACDPAGRFWAGSMAYDNTAGAGSLYRLDPDGSVRTVLRDVTISNGLGWSPDGSTLFYADSGAATVDAFDYDGDVSNRRTLVQTTAAIATDGLTVDDEGFIWAAMWGGGEVRRYTPTGELDAAVRVSARQVTCCCFGGSDGHTLFISTASIGLTAEERARTPDAGRVFAVRTAVGGPPATPFGG